MHGSTALALVHGAWQHWSTSGLEYPRAYPNKERRIPECQRVSKTVSRGLGHASSSTRQLAYLIHIVAMSEECWCQIRVGHGTMAIQEYQGSIASYT